MKIFSLNRRNQPAKEETARLYCECFAEEPWNEIWSVEAALHEVGNPQMRWWVARDESDEIVGFVAGITGIPTMLKNFDIPPTVVKDDVRRVGYLAELGVAPKLRRAGLARCLTAELLNFFKEEEVDQFIVRTRPGTGNHPWYESKLTRLFVHTDGRVVYGHHPGVPKL